MPLTTQTRWQPGLQQAQAQARYIQARYIRKEPPPSRSVYAAGPLSLVFGHLGDADMQSLSASSRGARGFTDYERSSRQLEHREMTRRYLESNLSQVTIQEQQTNADGTVLEPFTVFLRPHADRHHETRFSFDNDGHPHSLKDVRDVDTSRRIPLVGMRKADLRYIRARIAAMVGFRYPTSDDNMRLNLNLKLLRSAGSLSTHQEKRLQDRLDAIDGDYMDAFEVERVAEAVFKLEPILKLIDSVFDFQKRVITQVVAPIMPANRLVSTVSRGKAGALERIAGGGVRIGVRELIRLTCTQLRKRLETLGIKGGSRMTKTALVAAISTAKR